MDWIIACITLRPASKAIGVCGLSWLPLLFFVPRALYEGKELLKVWTGKTVK
jgi:hypothetical protein